GGVQEVLKKVRANKLEPAIWVAPFIAEAKSQVFKDHPGWFVRGADGKPLRSDRVTFGGWRKGPWYALDGTHPEVQKHLENVFRTMRRDWGCTYFKLDANFWGALPGGRFHDPKATRVEAYRRGMAAILRGAGDAFVLGCNHPIWPSLGLLHGSRSSMDIKRDWKRFKETARQNLHRNWQNGRLWWNDPDCLVLTGRLSANESRLHARSIFASGGMPLSGDDLTKVSDTRLAMLRKLVPPTGVAAAFEDPALRIGLTPLKENRVAACFFNWSDRDQIFTFRLPAAYRVHDFWADKDLGVKKGLFKVGTIPAHSAKVLICTPKEEERAWQGWAWHQTPS